MDLTDRKIVQAACKDINAILEPKPKINIIASAAVLGQKIVDHITTCIGVNEETGESFWKDERAGNLAPETIKLYEALVEAAAKAAAPEAAEAPAKDPVGDTPMVETAAAPEAATGEPTAAPEAATGEPTAAEGQEDDDCQAWVQKLGPTVGDAECDACPSLKECATRLAEAQKAEKAKAKADKAAKAAAAPPKAAKYNRVQATYEAFNELAKGTKSAAIEDIEKKSAELYVNHGGTDKIAEAKFFTKVMVQTLVGLGLAATDGKTLSLK